MLDVSGALSRVMEAWRSTPAWAHTGERRHQPIAELLWGFCGVSCPCVPMCDPHSTKPSHLAAMLIFNHSNTF